MSGKKIELCRGELYEMVWSTPVSRLSRQYGISDVGLKKVCTRLHVPTPPRGYLAKLRHGHDVSREPLPELPEGAPSVHTFHVRPKRARENRQPGKPAQDETSSLEIRRKITVPSTLRAPHPIVARTRAYLKSARPYRQGRVSTFGEDLLDVKVCPGSVRRALRIANTVLTEAERLSFSTANRRGRKSHVRLVVEGEEISFRIFEKIRQKELPREEDAPSWKSRDYEYLSTGNLRLEFTERYQYRRTRWRDGKKGGLESQIAAFLAGAYDLAMAPSETGPAVTRRRETQGARAPQKGRRTAAPGRGGAPPGPRTTGRAVETESGTDGLHRRGRAAGGSEGTYA